MVSTAEALRTEDTDFVRFWNEVLAPKFIRFKHILVGGLTQHSEAIFPSLPVVDADVEQVIWAERFDRDKVDILDLQDEISALVVARIETELGLTEQRKAERRPRKNLGAWDLYQLGTAEFYRFTAEANLRCQDLMRQSISIDPEFAGAHARLAYAIVLSMVYFDAPAEDRRMDEALAAAKRAIELDDQDANCYLFWVACTWPDASTASPSRLCSMRSSSTPVLL
jgi:hypothetical protein